MKHCLG